MASEIAKVARPRFRNVAVFSESAAHCEPHRVRDKRSVVEHACLLMALATSC